MPCLHVRTENVSALRSPMSHTLSSPVVACFAFRLAAAGCFCCCCCCLTGLVLVCAFIIAPPPLPPPSTQPHSTQRCPTLDGLNPTLVFSPFVAQRRGASPVMVASVLYVFLIFFFVSRVVTVLRTINLRDNRIIHTQIFSMKSVVEKSVKFRSVIICQNEQNITKTRLNNEQNYNFSPNLGKFQRIQ